MGSEDVGSEPISRATPRKGFVSLASRLAVIIFALVVLVSFVIAFELARRERAHYVDSKRVAGVMLTELFAASLAPALDFADVDAVAASLDTLSRNREVMDAAVWAQSSGKPFAELTSAGDLELAAQKPDLGVEIRDDYIDIVQVVPSPTGKRLGSVAVRVSLAREKAAFAAARRRIFWMAFGLSAVVAALLVAVLRRTIVSPVTTLEKAAQRLARGELALVMEGRDDEIGSLGRTFNGMARAIAEREERISSMNGRLQGLLDNMRQAIVVFDSNGNLGAERSKLARQLLGDDAGSGKNIADLLYPLESSSELEREAFQAWLEALGRAEENELDELSSLAPREVTFNGANGTEQVFELEFRRAPSEAGVRRFMLLATDVTSERQLQRTAESQARSYQKQLSAVRRLIAGGAQVFVRFLRSARERLIRARRSLDGSTRPERELLEELFRFVHTLRAEARSFDLASIEALASGLELSLAGARSAPPGPSQNAELRKVLERGFTDLSRELDAAEDAFVQSSPIGRRVLDQVTVSREDVEALYRRLASEPGEVGRLAARLVARPFGELTATLLEPLQRWSLEEDKVTELVISGRETLVPAPLCESLSGVLAHLLRNAVAHGIETPSERHAKQKPEAGRIELSCDDGPEGVAISVVDDGRGFDLDALRRRALEQGHAWAETVEDAFELAVLPRISTRERQDALAGYGVGLGAVKAELTRAGYTMRLAPRAAGGAQVSIIKARMPIDEPEGASRVAPAEAYHE